MNYNKSLDDIIKQNQFKNVPKSKKSKNFKNSAAPLRPRVKRNISSFKPKVKKKLNNMKDARIKILLNKKHYYRNGSLSTRNVEDARLKIEALKNKTKKRKFMNYNPVTTRVAANGTLLRKINSKFYNNTGVHVEYENEDINLEHEVLNQKVLFDKPFVLRRTVNNAFEKKSSIFYEDRKDYETMIVDSPFGQANENIDDDFELNKMTRTITNFVKKPSNVVTKDFIKKSSPIFLSSEDVRNSFKSRLNTSLREQNYHRITISNLHVNVTGEDIKELFEDVGDLIHAKMIKTGVAEVAYRSRKDAVKAVEIYHNRQLDGLPMKCVMLQSNENNSPKKYSSGLIPPVNTFISVEPDPRIIKKALFST